MRLVSAIAVVAMVVMLPSGETPDLLTSASVTADERHTEVVVFEAGRCVACPQFRDAIIRPYFRSGRGKTLPMHVVDFDALGTAGRALRQPVTELPTSVVLRGGIEVGRIVGNPGASRFLAAMDRLAAPDS
ncbi:MAG: hypothetical protein AAGJ70_00980 [Pseudomonadota bacterium]